MPKWTRPSEGLPQCDVGNRILLIVIERLDRRSIRKTPRLVILERTEIGWTSPDAVYAGYSVEDGDFLESGIGRVRVRSCHSTIGSA